MVSRIYWSRTATKPASSNLLFPREDKAESKLLFACRTCSFSEEAPSACVMRNEIASSAGDTAGVTSDIGQDPTVGLTRSFSRASLMELDGFPNFCTMCGQDIVCVDCGDESAPGLVLEAEDEHSLQSNVQRGSGEHSSKN
jgi:DNA-directed RNA polymerase II subunit RPB9